MDCAKINSFVCEILKLYTLTTCVLASKRCNLVLSTFENPLCCFVAELCTNGGQKCTTINLGDYNRCIIIFQAKSQCEDRVS